MSELLVIIMLCAIKLWWINHDEKETFSTGFMPGEKSACVLWLFLEFLFGLEQIFECEFGYLVLLPSSMTRFKLMKFNWRKNMQLPVVGKLSDSKLFNWHCYINYDITCE